MILCRVGPFSIYKNSIIAFQNKCKEPVTADTNKKESIRTLFFKLKIFLFSYGKLTMNPEREKVILFPLISMYLIE